MKKFWMPIILASGLATNGYSFINFGLKGGYAYQSITPTEIHRTTKVTMGSTTTTDTTTYTPTGNDAETKNPTGFGGELVFDITPPIIPLGIELDVGFYTGNYKEIEDTTGGKLTSTLTVNSIKISALGKYYIKKIPMISPWVGVGPFIGLNTHKLKKKGKMGEVTVSYEYKGEMVPNFGILGGAGVKVSIIPKLSLNIGVLLDYFIVAKGKYTAKYTLFDTTTETTYEIKGSQWNINALVGISYDIL
ncbi:outer membrane beta-barrel protein [candidate division WOR-3 bacterium]|nr:outer membrane beta-barrel protein [candidate division WOR-3 bacterium]